MSFPYDSIEKQSKVADFCTMLLEDFRRGDLVDFIESNSDSFFDNVVTVPYKTIQKGAKLVKSFKHFITNPQELRRIQDMASELIQKEKEIKGKLCFSVHPLDFLSSSENTYKWRSCHCLNGDHRAGNLSYMVDDCTFMVYIKGEDDCELPNFGNVRWNSKKWRVLFHGSENILFAGRQYPLLSKVALDFALSEYNLLLLKYRRSLPYSVNSSLYLPWRNTYIDQVEIEDEYCHDIEILIKKYLVYNKELVAISDVVKKGFGALNFNDVLESHCYKYPYYTFPINSFGVPAALIKNPLTIGDSITCLECGNDSITESEYMRCSDCQLEYGEADGEVIIQCDCCGRNIYADDAYVEESTGDKLCVDCVKSECFTCAECEGLYYNNTERNYHSATDDYYCNYCFNGGID